MMVKRFFNNLGDPSQSCKEYFLRSDIDLSSIVIGAAALLAPLMSILDYSYYGLGPEFYWAASLEAGFALLSVVLIFIIRHENRVKPYEDLVFAWSMLAALASIFAVFLQPTRVIENVLISEFLLIAIYMLVANRLAFRLGPVTLITVAYIAALFTTESAASTQQKYLITITLLMLDGVGLIIVERNNRFKRVEFDARNRERTARQVLETLAASDPLTGILNRRSFLEQAQLALDRHKIYGYSSCLAIFDLDRLKQINDTYGHLAGDEALKLFTDLIASQKRSSDIFGRLGGDEFGFILPKVSFSDATRVVSRLQTSVNALAIQSPKGIFHISFSAGLTEVRDDDRSPDDVIHRADECLYRSKGLPAGRTPDN
jgi:diguanylate cyclase (GGDEF)-like protein